MVMNLHIQPARLAGKGAAHAAHTDDPEPRTGELFADQHRGRPRLPLPAAHKLVPRHRMPRSPQHQHQRQFRRSIRQNAGRVRHDNSPRLEAGQVAVIHPDGVVGDDLEPGVKLGHHIGAEMLGVTGDHAIDLCAHRDDVLGAAGCVSRIPDHLIVTPRPVERGVRKLPGDPDDRLAHGSVPILPTGGEEIIGHEGQRHRDDDNQINAGHLNREDQQKDRDRRKGEKSK